MIKTLTSSRTLVLGGAACLVLAACVSCAAVVGARAAAWAAATCLAITLAVVLAAVRPARATIVREPFRRQELVGKKYPTFDALLDKLGSAVRDRRHFDRVLAPLLRDIARDLPQPSAAAMTLTRLRSALGDDLWPLLDPDRRPASSGRDEPAAPSLDELAELVGRLEHLEQPWT